MSGQVRSAGYRPRVIGAGPIGGAAPTRRQGEAGALPRWGVAPGLLPVAGVLAAFGFALAVRVLFLDRSYDVFIDEITYFLISRNLVQGAGVSLFGSPFFLHPPLFFFIEGPYIGLTHPPGPLIDQVLQARFLQAVLAALTGLAVLSIAGRIGGWRVGLIAFALFAIDPFVIRINSRNLLETTAILLVLCGYLALLWAPLGGGRIPWPRALLAGLCFGSALLTKEMTFFLTFLPMALLFVLDRPVPRRALVVIVGVAVSVYACYPAAAVLAGHGPDLVATKLSGLLRFLGIVKTTGFVHGGPSFLDAVTRNLDVFATTYALLGLGIPASVLLAWKGTPRRQVLGVLGLSAYGLLAYSVALGTLEEQFFYFLVLPSMLTVPVAWGFLVERLRGGEFARVRLPIGPTLDASRAYAVIRAGARVVLPAALAVSLTWSAIVWGQVHLTPDDGYRRLYAYLHEHVPQGERLAVTTDPQQFLLQGYVIELVRAPQDIVASRSRYAVVATKQIEDGYTRGGARLYAWLRAHARPVWVLDSRTYGRLEVYRIPAGTPG